MRMLRIIALFIFLSISILYSGVIYNLGSIEENIKNINKISRENLSTQLLTSDIQTTLNLETTVRIVSVQKDTFKNYHIIFNQEINDVPVFGRTFRVHTSKKGQILSTSNNTVNLKSFETVPTLSTDDIKLIIESEYIENHQFIASQPTLIVYIKDSIPYLCYSVDISDFNSANRYMLSSIDGSAVDVFPLIFTDGPVVGTGINLLNEMVGDLQIYEGASFGEMGDLITPNLVCEAYCWDYGDCESGNYNWCTISPEQGECDENYFEDCNGNCFHSWYMQFPGVGNGFCNDPWIEYYDENVQSGIYNMVDESNIDLGRIYTVNSYNGFYQDLSYVQSESLDFSSDDITLSHMSGVSAHDYQRKTLDYFWDYHQYAGIDGDGKRTVSVVNYGPGGGISVNNAFYNAALDVLTYGRGSGSYRPFCAAQDIVTHEFVHGFTAHTSGLIYRNQSGALNESMSDAFGFFVEAEYQNGGDWTQGEDVHTNGGASRSFIDPPSEGHPDHVNHAYFVDYNSNPLWSNDFGGVHTNLGIPNKVLYLVIAGDTHYGINVNPFNEDFDLSRIVASNIWFNLNAYYLDAEDDFIIAREKMLEVVYDMYPGRSDYYQTVANAWASTGVGDSMMDGDINEDQIINIQDIILTLQFILGNISLEVVQMMLADINSDGNIDVMDIIQVVNIILYG